MDDQPASHRERLLSAQLDLYLDREPISGRLRADWGAEERFEGWLGFLDALRRLQEQGKEPS